MTRFPRTKRCAGDNRLFREAYARHYGMDASFVVDRGHSPDACADYAAWLRSKGIDPETGRMTVDGLAFFERLLAEQRASKLIDPAPRRRP
jgi:hypothetical protein